MKKAKSKITDKILINQLKSNVIKLRCTYQLPYYLTYVIRAIDDKTDVEIINHLKVLTEHYLRVKGYYSKYVDLEIQADNDIEKLYSVNNNKIVKLF